MKNRIPAAAVLVIVLTVTSMLYTHRGEPVLVPLPPDARPAPGQSLAAALHYGGRVDLNRATVQDLTAGIGIERAHRIIRYRERVGGFRSIEELTEVAGIGEGSIERLRPYVELSH